VKQERLAAAIVNVAGLALTVACWLWAREGQRSDAWNLAIIWCAPLFVYPITLLGRKALDARPVVRRAEWANILVHYAMMIALGVGIFPALRLVQTWPGSAIPVPPQVGLVLVVVTGGLATLLTVLNLAWRGLGAPFAAKLSTRLATDWMYAWTRNPMLLSTLALLFSLALWYRSLWFVAWVAVSVSPGWIFFAKVYEERELEIRFGAGYNDYRARIPLLWPRRPRPPGGPAPKAGA
jgi:protein-S-isoprenylcysteine O-methyltransferase Ste14